MRKLVLYLIILSVTLFTFTACDPIYIEKTSETLSRGIYATADALYVGRVDLATKYITSIEGLIPVPKNRIKVTPVIANGIHYVILGDNLKGTSVVIVGSQEFNALVKANIIAKAELTQADKFQKEALLQAIINKNNEDALIAQNKKLQTDLDNWHKSIFFKAYIFCNSLWVVIPIVVVGLIVLCVFVPPALPILGTICGYIFRLASNAISGIVSFLGGLLPKKTTTT